MSLGAGSGFIATAPEPATNRRDRHSRPTDSTAMSQHGDDPVPLGLRLDLDEAFRVLEAIEDALAALEDAALAPALRDELATVIRLIHGRLGLDEGGLK